MNIALPTSKQADGFCDSSETAFAGLLEPQTIFADESSKEQSRSWPFAHTLALGLVLSALLWASIVLLIRYL